MQWWRRSLEMIIHQLQSIPSKGTLTTQPFVDDNSQGILISSGNWLPLPLLGCHVQRCPYCLLCSLGIGTMSHCRDAKVAEQDLVVSPKEDVLWLDIAVDAPLVMGILQGGSDLFDVRDNGGQ